MDTQRPPRPVDQGQGPERLPLPPMEALDDTQRAAAQALIDGPRKAIGGRASQRGERRCLLGKSRCGGALAFGELADVEGRGVHQVELAARSLCGLEDVRDQRAVLLR